MRPAAEQLLNAARTAKMQGDLARACGLINRALALYSHQVAAADGSAGLILRGRLHHLSVSLDLLRHRPESAERSARTALVLFEEAGDIRRQSMAWEDLGSVAIVRRQPDLALQLLGRALALCKRPQARARLRLNLALAHQQKGHYLAADAELERAAAVFRELGRTRDHLLALMNAATGRSTLSDLPGLSALLQAIREVGAVSHHPELHARYLMLRGVEAKLGGDPARAARLLRKALYINAEKLQSNDLAMEIRTVLAHAIVQRGERPGRAITILRDMLDRLDPEVEPGRRVSILRVLALALEARGEFAAATATFDQAAQWVAPQSTAFVGFRLYADHARALLQRPHPLPSHQLHRLLQNALALATRLDVPACALEVETLQAIATARAAPDAGLARLEELRLRIEGAQAEQVPREIALLAAIAAELDREKLRIEKEISAAFRADATTLQTLFSGLQAENPRTAVEQMVATTRSRTGAERVLLLVANGDAAPTVLVKSGFSNSAAEQLAASIWATVPAAAEIRTNAPEQSTMLLPLRQNGLLQGVLYLERPLGSPPRPFTTTDLHSCSLVANGLGSILRKQPIASGGGDKQRFTFARLPRPAARHTPLVTCTAAMLRVLDLVEMIKDTEIPVLILGESGTGKELIARALHDRGRRSGGRFVAVNCAAVPRDLLEAELFGHLRGAFTGAEKDRRGLLVEADGGTLFLDEIGEMPADLQAKLLRAIEEQQITPVGAVRSLRVNFRVIAATNVEITAAVAAGRFRADLYYRLNGFQLSLPPLRDRPGDIDLLVEHFLAEQAATGTLFNLTPEVRSALHNYDWPGNVRELRNVIQAAAILARHENGLIRTEHLPERVAQQVVSPPLADELLARLYASIEANGYHRTLEDVERYVLTAALERSGGNRRAAARTIALEESSVRTKLQRLGLDAGSGPPITETSP